MVAMLALSDDERDFVKKLVDTYGDKMYSKALYILKNEDDARDAVQDAFFKIIRHIDKFEGSDMEHEKMLSLVQFGLMALISKMSINHYNKRKKRNEHETALYTEVGDEHHIIEPEDLSADTEDIIISAEEYELVRKAATQLSQDLQAAVYLVYSREFSYSDAADYLGISISALKDRIYRAKKKMREILEGDFDELLNK